MKASKDIIAIIGLGYVGLPLCLAFGRKYHTIGFDIDSSRIYELQHHNDTNKECTQEEFLDSKYVHFSDKLSDIAHANIFIITLPTPIDSNKKPDISYLLQACESVGSVLKKNDIVIFESTTYPFCTRNECAPALQKASNLVFNKDFFLGYSPERINPGDKTHSLTHIKKITSGSTPLVAQKVDALYASIIDAGTYLVSSMEIAEAAKVIENAQRDINIAFMNEIYILLDILGIDMYEVLQATKTKWNFLPFYPGLVGGHCIGVDPYYLAYIAQTAGYHTKIISTGRIINDMMPSIFAQKLLKQMVRNKIEIVDSKILIVGFAFKADCTDIRNTKVPEVLKEFVDFGCDVSVFDSFVDSSKVLQSYGIELTDLQNLQKYDGILIVLRHKEFRDWDFSRFLKKNGVILEINP